MKTALFLSAIAAGVLTVSTATFAQNYGGAWAQSYGDVGAPSQRYAAPIDRFTASDLGYAGKATTPRRAR